eukprot:g5361.t1 g5361   contig2:380600-383244(+)
MARKRGGIGAVGKAMARFFHPSKEVEAKCLQEGKRESSHVSLRSSLSTLPPDLTSLVEGLPRLLEEVVRYENENRVELERWMERVKRVRCAWRRRTVGLECEEIYGDLCGAEEVLKRRMDDDDDGEDEELDRSTSLERAAYTTLHLLQELQSSSAQVSSMTQTPIKATTNNNNNNIDSLPSLTTTDASSNYDYYYSTGVSGVIIEKSRFLMKLAPRIRRLESDTVKCLVVRLEGLLMQVRHLEDCRKSNDESGSSGHDDGRKEKLLLMIGHCLRGLALLGKGADAESAFARVAIMPIVRSKLSMGKLDEGGSRGECAGLFFLLDDIANTVASMYGSILRSSEGMFTHGKMSMGEGGDGGEGSSGKLAQALPMEVDLVTCGVWVPVATALMADPGIKMAIFSPGIANVLQANYSAVDTFLSELASSLLKSQSTSEPNTDEEKSNQEPAELGDFSHLYYRPTLTPHSIARAQSRLYSHPTTVEFSKKWNLPIYYQLRFAEFCKRLDKALERVTSEGWEADVFTGEQKDAEAMREQLGFELPLFLELYDVLISMWKDNVFLRPLAHRFLRGGVQLVGRVLAFVKDGLDGNVEFGGSDGSGDTDEGKTSTFVGIPAYHWNKRVEDVAAVSWELTILEACMTHDFLEVVANTVSPQDKESRQSTHNSGSELEEIKALASDVLVESSQDISPLIMYSWSSLIVDNLTSQCCIPLSAVKGVAATYRMTNRPPPTQASPFVATILRPLQTI